MIKNHLTTILSGWKEPKRSPKKKVLGLDSNAVLEDMHPQNAKGQLLLEGAIHLPATIDVYIFEAKRQTSLENLLLD